MLSTELDLHYYLDGNRGTDGHRAAAETWRLLFVGLVLEELGRAAR